MYLIVTRAFPPELGGMQSLMWGLTKEMSKNFMIKVFADHIEGHKEFDEQASFSIERIGGPKFLRKYRKASLIDEFTKNNKVEGIHFQFNGWGDKYPTYERVGSVPNTIAEYFNVPLYEAPFILEGGAICVDGEGTLIATEHTLLNQNRNPSMSKEDIE